MTAHGHTPLLHFFPDCYVAATGLPKPRKDHAVVLTLFANDCLVTIQRLRRKLSVTLGPDTMDLSLRVGLNSGPGRESRRDSLLE